MKPIARRSRSVSRSQRKRCVSVKAQLRNRLIVEAASEEARQRAPTSSGKAPMIKKSWGYHSGKISQN